MRWFTSDHHFGHANIIDFCDRPFDDVQDMNEQMVDLWNEVVAPDDTVFYLGDFVMNEKYLWVADYLNGKKVLVPGNHDGCWMGRSTERRNRSLPNYTRYFREVVNGPVSLLLSSGEWVTLNHFPGRRDRHDQSTQRYDAKFGAYEYDGEGWVLHGHTHSERRVNPEKKLFHVGVDAWGFRPVSETVVMNTIAKLERA